MLAPILSGAETRRHPVEAAEDIRTLDDIERAAIEQAIRLCDGNMTKAAQRLGISVKTIYRKRAAWDGPSTT